jgi:hypothetical protein
MINGTPARPGGDSALPQGKFPIGYYEVLIEIHFCTEAVAIGTGAIGAVEGKITGSQLRHADAAFRAGILLAEKNFVASSNIDPDESVGKVGGNLQGIP